MFVTNNDIPEYAIKEIEKLKNDTHIIGIEKLLMMIDELPSYNKREIGKYLNIDRSFFAQDYLNEIIEDLLKDLSVKNDNVIKYERETYFPDKVEINFPKEDYSGIMNEYEKFVDEGVFDNIKNILSGFEDDDKKKIKQKIIIDYNNLYGIFKERFKQLVYKYLVKYSSENDDEYSYYIRAILLYIFEQCLIGQKTKKEK